MDSFIYDQIVWVSFIGNHMTYFLSVFACVVALFFILDLKKDALLMCLAPLSTIYVSIIKLIIREPRPSLENVVLRTPADYYSFPSSHVVLYTVFFGFLIYTMLHRGVPRVIKIALISVSVYFISLVGVSRVVLQAHYVRDVIAGYVFGLIYLLGMIYLERKLSKNAIAKNKNNNR